MTGQAAMVPCLTSATLPRRVIVRAAGTLLRRPRTAASHAAMLTAARKTCSFADWIAVRAGDVIAELEDTR